jgi:hypothetical protein
VLHLAEHGVSQDEAEYVILHGVRAVSRTSGHVVSFARTRTGRYLAVVWERVEDDPMIVRPITAYDVPEPRSGRHERRKP